MSVMVLIFIWNDYCYCSYVINIVIERVILITFMYIVRVYRRFGSYGSGVSILLSITLQDPGGVLGCEGCG